MAIQTEADGLAAAGCLLLPLDAAVPMCGTVRWGVVGLRCALRGVGLMCGARPFLSDATR